jgi:hypothetical protein
LVCESQTAFSDPEVVCSIAYIRSNFGWLPASIKLPLQESMDIIKNESEKFSVVKAEAGEIVSTKLQAVLKEFP